MLKKYLGDSLVVIPIRNVGVNDNLSYEKLSVQILDFQVHKLRTKEVVSIRVLLKNQFIEETIWEAEENMKAEYLHLFLPTSDDL